MKGLVKDFAVGAIAFLVLAGATTLVLYFRDFILVGAIIVGIALFIISFGHLLREQL